MRKIIAATLVLSILVLSRCKTHEKVVYNMPAGSNKEEKKAFLEKMAKGAELYKANCSGCHGIFTKGLDSIPNFTHEQVDNYSSGFLRGDQKNHAVVIKMSNDQFFSIMGFLTARIVDTTVHQNYHPPKPAVQFN